MASSSPEEIPFAKSKAPVPQGVSIPMCFCGDLCKLMTSEVIGDTYGIRFFICTNYEHDPPKFFGRQRPKSPPPLRDFFQWLDTVQSDEAKNYVKLKARNARESWQRTKYDEQQEERRKKEQAEIRRRKEEAEREEAKERERERERKRERIRRAKETGPEATRKGKYPRCTQ